MRSIVNNILYAIDAFGIIQLYLSLSFFSFGKISCKTFKYENKSIPLRSKKLSSFKKPSRLT